LTFDRYAGLAGDRFIERVITDEIMYELMDLSGRQYVDLYAAAVKAAAAGTGEAAGVAVERAPAAAA
jgi:1-acyl-sn-glycerol-3-phosphate acyltransferase